MKLLSRNFASPALQTEMDITPEQHLKALAIRTALETVTLRMSQDGMLPAMMASIPFLLKQQMSRADDRGILGIYEEIRSFVIAVEGCDGGESVTN